MVRFLGEEEVGEKFSGYSVVCVTVSRTSDKASSETDGLGAPGDFEWVLPRGASLNR